MFHYHMIHSSIAVTWASQYKKKKRKFNKNTTHSCRQCCC